ncbi:MAG: tetratricopeptide repeat protein [Acidobacteria bacterium]|nr:tetratricopeptide repeat protein [Acidobacteriota bacterium]
MRGATIRRTFAICALAVGLALIAAPASAQSGQVKGKVTDAKGQPIDGAKVTIANIETAGRKLETKTNKKGEYIQIGLQPGRYTITVEKGDLKDTKHVQIHLDMSELNFTLAPGTGTVSKEDAAKAAAKNAAIQKAFGDGVQLSNEGKNEEAIAKFQEVLATVPKCAECYANIATIQARMKEYDKAEASFKQAIEVKPDFAEAYNGLATVYNTQKKFDLAAETSKKAAELGGAAAGGAGNASVAFNQGVILWNAGKIADAKAQFEQAVKIDPNMAEAHYWLGMATVNEGKTAEAKPHFETYLKLAPTGQYAETAKSILSTIK